MAVKLKKLYEGKAKIIYAKTSKVICLLKIIF